MEIWVIVLAQGMDVGGFDDPSNEGRTAYVEEVVGFFMTEEEAETHATKVWGTPDAVNIIKVAPPIKYDEAGLSINL